MVTHIERPIARRSQDPSREEIQRRAAAIRRNWSCDEQALRSQLASLYQLQLLACGTTSAA
ncbi:MAG: hypothetical protein QM775_07455 [Pirellulales bacterium]